MKSKEDIQQLLDKLCNDIQGLSEEAPKIFQNSYDDSDYTLGRCDGYQEACDDISKIFLEWINNNKIIKKKMNKNKWIILAICVVVALLVIGGFVWFLKSATWFAGVYYLISLIVVAGATWFGRGKWDEKKKSAEKQILHD